MSVRRGFTLIELLVSVAVMSVLISILLPALGGARESARTVLGASNLRQLAIAWRTYANDYDGFAMPLAYTDLQDVGTGDSIFWWGSAGNVSGEIEYERGFIAPYIDGGLREGSVFQCPSQPEGTYIPQGSTGQLSTTYGYNGYYLCPPKTPGWSFTIGSQRWKRVSHVLRPSDVFVFGDTLLPGSSIPRSSSLLDPPMLYEGDGEWRINQSPTSAFRHHAGGGRGSHGAMNAAASDGSVQLHHASPDWIVFERFGIGSVGTENGPHYVPDWERWN